MILCVILEWVGIKLTLRPLNVFYVYNFVYWIPLSLQKMAQKMTTLVDLTLEFLAIMIVQIFKLHIPK